MIRIAVPNKGRLREPTLNLLARVGLELPRDAPDGALLLETRCRRYRVLSVNAWDVPSYVAMGAADCAVTGADLVAESGVALPPPTPLGFGRGEIVLAVPETCPARGPEELPEGARVATSYPRVAEEFFRRRGRKVRTIPVSGAAEATPGIGVADAIVDLSDTGATLRRNGLRPIASLLRTEAGLFAGNGLEPGVERSVSELALAMRSVALAAGVRYLMANVPRALLPELPSLVPGVEGPTVLPLLGRDDWVAVHAVVAADEVNAVVAVLKGGGATGILIASLDRVVP